MTDNNALLWTPTASRIARSRMTEFGRHAGQIADRTIPSYRDLHAWSVASPDQLWPAVWDFCGVVGERGERVLLHPDRMPGATWFPEARLNVAENLLRYDRSEAALVFWGEDRVKRSLSRRQLREQAAKLAAAFGAMGVRPGDRVAANMPKMIVTMLAAARRWAVGRARRWCVVMRTSRRIT